MCMNIFMFMCVYAYVYVCVYIIYAFKNVHMDLSNNINKFIYIYIYKYIHIQGVLISRVQWKKIKINNNPNIGPVGSAYLYTALGSLIVQYV
jgi:hypothetical protein